MFNFWFAIPSWIRIAASVLMVSGGLTMAIVAGVKGPAEEKDPVKQVFEDRQRQGQFRAGFVLASFGTILFLLAGNSKARKNGYSSID